MPGTYCVMPESNEANSNVHSCAVKLVESSMAGSGLRPYVDGKLAAREASVAARPILQEYDIFTSVRVVWGDGQQWTLLPDFCDSQRQLRIRRLIRITGFQFIVIRRLHRTFGGFHTSWTNKSRHCVDPATAWTGNVVWRFTTLEYGLTKRHAAKRKQCVDD